MNNSSNASKSLNVTKKTSLRSSKKAESAEPEKADENKMIKKAKPKTHTKPNTSTKPKATVARSKANPKKKVATTNTKFKSDSELKKAKGAVRPKHSSKMEVSANSKSSLNNVFNDKNNEVPDLNTGAGYPVHPNRIWPD